MSDETTTDQTDATEDAKIIDATKAFEEGGVDMNESMDGTIEQEYIRTVRAVRSMETLDERQAYCEQLKALGKIEEFSLDEDVVEILVSAETLARGKERLEAEKAQG